MIDAFVVIVNCDRQDLLGVALADDIIVQHLENLGRGRDAFPGFHQGGFVLFPDDLHAQFDAFIANEYRRTRNQLADLVLALSAEGAIEGVFRLRSTRFAHSYSFPPPSPLKTLT